MLPAKQQSVGAGLVRRRSAGENEQHHQADGNAVQAGTAPEMAGVFEAKLGETIICRSRQPFVDGARALLAMGYDPEMVLVMRHATTGTDALRAATPPFPVVHVARW